MFRIVPYLFFLLFILPRAMGQACTPQGNQTSYGNNNVWRGYVYNNADFTNYRGFVTEGTAGSPNFDQSFGGSNTTYSTNGCSAQTESFSIRYKLRKTFANGRYNFTVGGDDGYRLSLDGGTTWEINQWNDQAYNTTTYSATLNGICFIVLEYYENTGENRVSFNLSGPCGTENTTAYGTNDIWNGYLYQGMNFDAYAGMINEGIAGNPAFSEDFTGNNVLFATSGCNIHTEGFSARFRLTKNFADGDYTFFLGGDDGYRLSLDGGSTWIIDNWTNHPYAISNATVHLNGIYNLVIEFYENGGDNLLNFSFQFGSPLDIKLITFNGIEKNRTNHLNWSVSAGSNPDHFELQRSIAGTNFSPIAIVQGKSGIDNGAAISYHFADDAANGAKSLYRLKMIDIDGTITYSKIIYISESVYGNQAVKIFPTTPVNNQISVQPLVALPNAHLSIIDVNGRTISSLNTGRLAAGQVISVPLPGNIISRHIYLVRIVSDGKVTTTEKIFVQ